MKQLKDVSKISKDNTMEVLRNLHELYFSTLSFQGTIGNVKLRNAWGEIHDHSFEQIFESLSSVLGISREEIKMRVTSPKFVSGETSANISKNINYNDRLDEIYDDKLGAWDGSSDAESIISTDDEENDNENRKISEGSKPLLDNLGNEVSEIHSQA